MNGTLRAASSAAAGVAAWPFKFMCSKAASKPPRWIAAMAASRVDTGPRMSQRSFRKVATGASDGCAPGAGRPR